MAKFIKFAYYVIRTEDINCVFFRTPSHAVTLEIKNKPTLEEYFENLEDAEERLDELLELLND